MYRFRRIRAKLRGHSSCTTQVLGGTLQPRAEFQFTLLNHPTPSLLWDEMTAMVWGCHYRRCCLKKGGRFSLRLDCKIGRSVAWFLVVTCQSSVASCIYYPILWQQGREPVLSFFFVCFWNAMLLTWETENRRGLSTETKDRWRAFFHFKERMAFTDFLSLGLIAEVKESRNRGNAASNRHQSPKTKQSISSIAVV